MSLSAILPMRAGSKRVPEKNMRAFASFPYGLAQIKLRQLLEVELFEEIIVDTDEPRIDELLSLLAGEGLEISRIRVERRDPALAGDLTSTDDLIRYVGGKVKSTHTLWTHVTSPFVSSNIYLEAIKSYDKHCLSGRHDSLMAVTPLKEFIWDQKGPVNYDYTKEKWPRTQTLPDWFFINSAIFMAPTKFLQDLGNRIGETPFLFQMDKLSSLDIDGPDDFAIAEAAYKAVFSVIVNNKGCGHE